jgi:hypothetical protein
MRAKRGPEDGLPVRKQGFGSQPFLEKDTVPPKIFRKTLDKGFVRDIMNISGWG